MFIYLRATVNVHTFSKKKIAMCFTQCTRCTHDIIYPKYMLWGLVGQRITHQVKSKFLKIFLDLNYNLIKKNPNVLLLKTEYLRQLL